MKIGSLFDGIGVFCLAAQRNGIEPIWASEIENLPIQVTKKHFPRVKHLGDITQINGAEIEPVDIITAGSPCQDLSRGGRGAGLNGKRSGLFMEFIRIVREMREATNNEYPRYIVWENVLGAFTSNKGADFRAVLEEVAEADIPIPQSGRWATAGMVRGNGREIAWRVLDSQYWGVPQRRNRIFLVCDFRGECAGEILFEQESLRRNPEKIREKENQRHGEGVPGVSISSWWNGGQVSQTLDHVLYKKQAMPEKNRFPAVLVPAWEKCKPCEDYICNIHHGKHVSDCGCPELDEWRKMGVMPYEPCILRFITPLEGERIMGLPDDWTNLGSDTARYKAIGNSMVVPCAEWIMERIGVQSA